MPRLFVAAPIGDEARARIGEVLSSLAPIAPTARWVAPENLHLTLRFLGPVDETAVPSLAGALAAGLSGTPACAMAITGAGSFGSARRPRVLSLDLEGELDRLQAISDRVDVALDALGLPPRDRPFTPHLTLARARDRGGDPSLAQAREALVGQRFGALPIREVILYESVLNAKGARYTARARVVLGDADPIPAPGSGI